MVLVIPVLLAAFILQAENERTLFSFFNVGSIRLKTNQAASACNQS